MSAKIDTTEPDNALADDNAFVRNLLLADMIAKLEAAAGAERAGKVAEEIGCDMGAAASRACCTALGAERLSRKQVADLLVEFKGRMGGEFTVLHQDEECIVFRSQQCSFGRVPARSLCRLSAGLFGTAVAQNLGYARVQLEETIAHGGRACRIVVHLERAPRGEDDGGTEYCGQATGSGVLPAGRV